MSVIVSASGPSSRTLPASTIGTHLLHHPRDARHAHLDAALRGDVVRHEREVGAIAIAEFRRDADAVEAADDAVSGAQVAELAAFRAVRRDHDRGVHPLTADV